MTEQTQQQTSPPALPPEREEELASLVQQAQSHISAGDPDSGLASFREIAQRFPSIPEVFNNLGAVCTAMERFEEAGDAFARAIELSPESANPHFNLGMIQFRSGDYFSACDNFRKASELSPEDPEILNNLGVVCFQLERWSEAREAFAKALTLLPEYVSPRLNLVDVDLAEGRPDDAVERCRPLAEESQDPEVWAKLVDCAFQRAERVLDDTAEVCESTLGAVGENAELRERFGRVVRARQILLSGSE